MSGMRRRDLLAAIGGAGLLPLLTPIGPAPMLGAAAAGPVVPTVGGQIVRPRLIHVAGGFRPVTAGYLLPAGQAGELLFAPQAVVNGSTALGAHWAGDVVGQSRVRVLVRWRGAHGTWSGWTALPALPGGEGDASAALFRGPLYLPIMAVTVQARLQARTPSGLLLSNVVLSLIRSTDGSRRSAGRYHPLDLGRGVSVVPRDGWGCPTGEASPLWAPFYQTPSHIVIHHTEGPNGGPDASAQMRSIWHFHTYTRGWGDIGYNYLIDRAGVIYEGRAGGADVVGAHAERHNVGTVGIALLGSYGTTDPPRAMLLALASLIAAVAARYGIDPQGTLGGVDGRRYPALVGHRDVYNTMCPGDRLYSLLPLLRSAF